MQLVRRLPLFVFFTFLCAMLSWRRSSAELIRNSEHGNLARKFFTTVLVQYLRRRDTVPFFRPTYLSLEGRKPTTRRHYYEFAQSPLAYFRLWQANVLKNLGLFYDSEYLYRQLQSNVAVQALALIGLGDLILLQARWTREFRDYEQEGVAFNPFSEQEKTWLGRQYAEAIDTLSHAVLLDGTNHDAWELLGYAYRDVCLWPESLVCIRRCSSRQHSTALRVTEAAVLFGTSRPAGLAAMRSALAQRPNWELVDAEVISSAELNELNGVKVYEKERSTSLCVKSHIVRDTKILTAANVISFPPSYVAHYMDAESLPHFGMLLINGKYLLEDSLHHKRCHWSLFTPSVAALAGDRALISRQSALDCTHTGAIFIGYNRNYYHWIFDELPRLASIADDVEFENYPILADAQIDAWQVELLKRVGVDRSRVLTVDFRQPVRFRNLIAPSHVSTMMIAHPSAVQFMRKKIVPHAASMTSRHGKRLYLARLSANERKSSLINERRVIERFKKANFSVIDPGTMTISEQMDVFSDADVIAGPGGAAMANALFAPANARILELSSAGMLCETFGSVATSLGQEHWWCVGTSYPRSYPAWIWTTFDYEISDRDIDLCFEHVL